MKTVERFGLFASGAGIVLIGFSWHNEMWVALTLSICIVVMSLFIMFLLWALQDVQEGNGDLRDEKRDLQGRLTRAIHNIQSCDKVVHDPFREEELNRRLGDTLQPPNPDGSPYLRR